MPESPLSISAAAAPPPSASSGPLSPSQQHTSQAPRRRPASRACDRCRKRKARCDFETSGKIGGCTPCRDAAERCTFDLPLGRRGPKAKRKPTDTGSDLDCSIISNEAQPADSLPSFPTRRPSHHGPRRGLSFAGSATSPSATTWESSTAGTTTTGLTLADRGLSPQTIHSSTLSIATPGIGGAGVGPATALQRWQSLSRALALRNAQIDRMVTRCLDMFFEYLYPLTPLVHEPSLRESLAFFLSQTVASSHGQVTSPLDARASSIANLSDDFQGSTAALPPDSCRREAAFTLITAVCAEAAFLLPKDIFPEGESVADVFLQASRSCLNSYLEADLENPSAASVAIRYFHSNCVHAAGKPKYSWHIFGEATRLAQVMHLHEEASLEGLFPVEAELRRRVFWIVYMGDKSAAILNNRPITIHKFSFESGITTSFPTGIEDEMAMGPSPGNATSISESSPRSFIEGFNANLRLWQAASDLLLEIRLIDHQESRDLPTSATRKPLVLTADHRQRLESLFVRFITCLDILPPYLQSYTFAAIANGGSERTQSNQFIIQCANLQVSLHCLRMVITQKFEELSYYDIGVEQADLRKTEIARDMLRVMHEAPFWSLQVNGEPYVEKIRLIGASLLAIIHRNQNSPLADRARGDFSVLLDILTRLDSKASDALKNNSSSVL